MNLTSWPPDDREERRLLEVFVLREFERHLTLTEPKGPTTMATAIPKADQPSKNSPHVVTTELAARGNELMAEAQAAHDMALSVGRQIEALEKVKEELWETARSKRWKASETFLGPTDYSLYRY